jgi:hypothetical protein
MAGNAGYRPYLGHGTFYRQMRQALKQAAKSISYDSLTSFQLYSVDDLKNNL